MYHSGIVFQKHVVEIFGNEGRQTGPGQGLVVEAEEEEGGSEAVEALNRSKYIFYQSCEIFFTCQ